ncbi:MAG TPA: hypothetical protein VFG89_08455 [Coriobacteriia bacterium]|nr:hypothetical protein [Coriobacteriia bacterium]
MIARVLVFAIVVVSLSVMTGCRPSEKPNQPAIGATVPAQPASSAPQPPSSVRQEVSSAALDYARGLGGTAQTDAELYLVVGTLASDETEAQLALDAALPLFGDMQSYFIIQKSDNFEGVEPGVFMVVEAYDSEPSAENLEFARRAFPGAKVVRVKVLTADPIPVYDQLVPQ